MDDSLHVLQCDAGLSQSRDDAESLVVQRGGNFCESDGACCHVDRDEVREGAANVDSDDQILLCMLGHLRLDRKIGFAYRRIGG